jgi:hypothetical protein
MMQLLAKIIGAVTFVLIVVDFWLFKRRPPVFIITISMIAMAGAILYSICVGKSFFDAFLLCLFLFCSPYLLWFLCGGSILCNSRNRDKG